MNKQLSITLKVDAKTGQVNAVKNSFDDLDRKVSQTNNNTSSFKSTLMGLAGATVVVMGISKAFELAIGQAESFLDTGSKFEQYENGLSSFYVGQTALNKALTLGREFSDDYNVSIDETFKAMHLMKVYGIDATAESLEKYGNIAKGSMKSIEQFVEAMADAFMGENERLKEFGVKASVQGKKVAYSWTDSSGKARSVIIENNRKMIESTLLTIYNEKYVGQMAKYAGSWSGFVQGIKTDYENFQIDVMSAGLLAHIQATSEAFYAQWAEAFGNTEERAKYFSDFISDSIDNIIISVAFLIDAWTAFKLVKNIVEVVVFGIVSTIGDMINWVANKWGEFTTFMHNSYKTSVDGIWKTWYEFMNFLGVDIKEVVKTWDSFTTILGKSWDSVTEKMATGFSDFSNYVIEKINSIIDGFMSLGNDVLGFLGFDKLEKIAIPLVDFKKSIEDTKEPLNVYVSDIERAVHSTEKFVDFKFSNSIFEESKKNVIDYYDTLKNNSASSFVENMMAKRTEALKEETKATDGLTKKTKEAKDALAELLELHSGKLPESIKKGSTAQKAQNALLKEAKQLEQERIKKTNSLVKEAKQLERERVKEAEAVAKAWDDTYDAQMKGFEEFTKNKNEAYKEYLRIMGDFEQLAKIENSEKVLELKPYLSNEELELVAKQLEELSELPSFKDGIADAFGVNTNASLKENISQLKYDLGTIASDLFVGLLKDYQQTGDIGQSIQNMTDDNAVGNAFMASGNPYLMAASLAGSVIGDAMSEPLTAFQAMEANVHKDNKSIIGSLEILENVTYPQLKVATQSRDLLYKISSSFQQIGRQLSYGSSSGFVLGSDFTGSVEYNGNQDVIQSGNFYGNISDMTDELGIFGQDIGSELGGYVGDFHTALSNSILGSDTPRLTGSGIMNESQSGRDFIDNNSSRGYQDVRTDSSSIFGLIKSSSTDTRYQELPQDVTDRLAQAYADGLENILTLGTSLGFERTDLLSIFEDHITEAMKLELKGKTQAEIEQYLRGYFGNEFDTIINEMMPGIQSVFQTAEETTMEALTRVATSFESGNYSISRLGFEMVEFDSIVSNIDLANLNASTEEFVRGFYTNAEQVALSGRDVNESFLRLGIAMPKSKEEFRNLVESLDLTTEGGRATYAALMSGAGAFASFRDGIESILKPLRDAQSAYAVPRTYTSASVYDEIDNYTEYGNDAVSDSIDGWYAQEVARLEATKSYQVTIDNSHNKALNAQIELSNAWHDSIKSMQETSKKGLTSLIIDNAVNRSKALLSSSIANKDVDGINLAYASIVENAKNNSYSRADELKKVALANFEIQQIEAPEKRDLLDVSIRTETHTRDISNEITALNLQTYNMYEQFIKNNEKDLEFVEDITNKDTQLQTTALIEDAELTRSILAEARDNTKDGLTTNTGAVNALSLSMGKDFTNMREDTQNTAKDMLSNFGKNTEIHGNTTNILENSNALFGLAINKNLQQDSDISKLTKEMTKLVKQNEELVKLNKAQLKQNENQSKELNEMKNSENRREAREKANA